MGRRSSPSCFEPLLSGIPAAASCTTYRGQVSDRFPRPRRPELAASLAPSSNVARSSSRNRWNSRTWTPPETCRQGSLPPASLPSLHLFVPFRLSLFTHVPPCVPQVFTVTEGGEEARGSALPPRRASTASLSQRWQPTCHSRPAALCETPAGAPRPRRALGNPRYEGEW